MAYTKSRIDVMATRQDWANYFIENVMDEVSGTPIDLSNENDREVIILALQDAVEFFNNLEFNQKIDEEEVKKVYKEYNPNDPTNW